MDIDVSGLADAVEAADALLEDFGIAGEAEEDEVAGELEVPAFGADFRADEDACAFGFLEVGGVPIALEHGEFFVEEGGLGVDDFQELFLDHHGGVRGVCDEEDFFVFREFFDEAGEPCVGGGAFLHGVEDGQAFREAGEALAGVAEEDAAGAEGVDEGGDEWLAGGFIAFLEGEELFFCLGGVEGEIGDVLGDFSGGEGFYGFGEGGVGFGFCEEVVEIGVAVWIEQAEAGEVAFGAELLWGGGEEEEGLDFLRECLDGVVGGGGFVFVPLEVVCFIDDEEVEACFACLGGAVLVFREEIGGG